MPDSDHSTTVADLRQLMRHFVETRQWQPFHTPKNLAASIAIETGELMEHFQWLTPEESIQLAGQVDPDSPIAQEISDVLAYLLSLANALELDLSQSFRLKMKRNEQKYPAPPRP